MFERFTEKARRVIFFARYEASQYGSPCIETEHLLLGLLRENKGLANRYLPPPASPESIRKEIESHISERERVPTSVDMPLSTDSKRVLNLAVEEAEKMGHRHIGTEHLLLGLLRVEKCLAAKVLAANKVSLEGVRQAIVNVPASRPSEKREAHSAATTMSAEVTLRDFLTALRGGRKEELEDLLAPQIQFIDFSGKRLSGGGELKKNMEELFAPFAAKSARFVEEASIEPCEDVFISALLWQDVPLRGQEAKGLLRMTVVLSRGFRPMIDWLIYSIQVTPVRTA